MTINVRLPGDRGTAATSVCVSGSGAARAVSTQLQGSSISIGLPFACRMQRMLNCLDLGTIASEDLCGEGGHFSGRLPEVP
jgi:hypothetical protein